MKDMGKWYICILGGLTIVSPNGKVFSRRTKQGCELIRALVVAGSEGLSSQSIADYLFDENWLDPKAGVRNILARMSQWLKEVHLLPLLRREGDRIHLITENVDTDLWNLRSLHKELIYQNDKITERKILRLIATVNTNFFLSTKEHSRPAPNDVTLTIEIFTILIKLSSDPKSFFNRSTILSCLNVIRDTLPLGTSTIEGLFTIFAGLGLRQELLETYVDYEQFLDTELGDKPSVRIEKLVDGLINQLDKNESQLIFTPPNRPKVSFGRECEIDQIIDYIFDGEVVFCGGISGIGKSHLMKMSFHDSRLSPFRKVWIDLKELTMSKALQNIQTLSPEIIFIDNYSSNQAEYMAFLLKNTKFRSVIFAGNTPLGIEYSVSLTLQPLTIGTKSKVGEATFFLKELLKNSDEVTKIDDCIALTQLCEGVPLIIEFAGRLAATFGLGPTLNQMERRFENSQKSGFCTINNFLLVAFEETVGQFPDPIQKGIAALCGFEKRVSLDLADRCLNLDLYKVKTLIASGLVIFNKENESIEFNPSLRQCIVELDGYEPANLSQISFESEVADLICNDHLWFTSRKEASVDVSAAQTIIENLIKRDNIEGAIKILRSIRLHLGIVKNSDFDVTSCRDTFFKVVSDFNSFIECGLAIGASYFYQYKFKEMLDFVHEMLKDPRSLKGSLSLQSELWSQLGLAKRLNSDFHGSLVAYEEAFAIIDPSDHPGLSAKLLYNRALSLRELKLPLEALKCLREAIAYSSSVPNLDSKIELLHIEGLLMSETNEPDHEVISHLSTALAYARMYKLKSQEGWILQNISKTLHITMRPAETAFVACCGLLEHMSAGFTLDFRRIAKSTFVILGNCMVKLGLESLGGQCVIMVDRLAESDVYPGNIKNLHLLQNDTFKSPFSVPECPLHKNEVFYLISECMVALHLQDDVRDVARKFNLQDYVNPVSPKNTLSSDRAKYVR
jgi:tetratricopeptide (TPR) repeat protein